jgi:glycosyltransferase involved in cell wall biosynthesis
MPDPKLSVLMPVYNAARYLTEAVESILAQTFRNFEFVIVNDGSTDRSTRILERFAKRDARIHLITRPNTGIVGALNDGLQYCKCDLIARMDADDVSMPERFERQLAFMDAHPQVACLGTRVLGIDPYGGVLFTSDHALTHEQIDAGLLRGSGWSIVHPAAMMRKNAVLAVGGYRKEFQWAEDLDLFLRLAETAKLANLPDVLLQYRQHPDSVNRTKQNEQVRVITAVVHEAHKRRSLSIDSHWTFTPAPVLPKDKQLRSWAWKALGEGKVSIARKYALAAWQSSPLNVESWRALICAMRGY